MYPLNKIVARLGWERHVCVGRYFQVSEREQLGDIYIDRIILTCI
jgi:hypothetical protein